MRNRSDRQAEAEPFDTRLRSWREGNRVSLRELAGLSGVSVAELSRAERGLAELAGLKKLAVARAVGMKVEELFPVEGRQ